MSRFCSFIAPDSTEPAGFQHRGQQQLDTVLCSAPWTGVNAVVLGRLVLVLTSAAQRLKGYKYVYKIQILLDDGKMESEPSWL